MNCRNFNLNLQSSAFKLVVQSSAFKVRGFFPKLCLYFCFYLS